jgi:hypothetical protein
LCGKEGSGRSLTITAAAAQRRTLAEKIGLAYAGDPRVAAVLLGGSTARGHADRYSDLVLSVAWTEPPTEDDRAAAISTAHGDLVTLYPLHDGVWCDAWKIGRRDDVPFTGIEVDMSHCLVDTVEQCLRDVIDDCDPEPVKQLVVGGILHAIPLHGSALVERWQKHAAHYPDGLRLAVVRTHAQIEGLWRLDAFAARGNPVAGYQVLTAAHEDLLHVLLGLNRTYYSGFKSLTAVVRDFPLAPPDLLERMRASYPLEVGRSKAMLTALAEETHDLVETQLPEIDVGRLREILRYDRPLWE